jgi:hypothetical protein
MKFRLLAVLFSMASVASGDVTNGLVAYYPEWCWWLGGSWCKNAVTGQPPYAWKPPYQRAVLVPAPFAEPTTVFSASVFVLDEGRAERTQDHYLTADGDYKAVLLITHFLDNGSGVPEGSYYTRKNNPTDGFLASIKAANIANRWTHYAVVSDTNCFSLYMNGEKVASTNVVPFAVSGDWYLGSWWSSPESGEFRALRIYSRALADWEVRRIYMADTGSHLAAKDAAMRVRWGAMEGVTYEVQSSNDLLTWSNLASVQAEGGEASMVVPVTSAQSFYRFNIGGVPVEDIRPVVQTAAMDLRWLALSNVTYQVQWSADFRNWVNLATLAGSDAETNVVDWNYTLPRFYRLQAVP